jgi:hypothetical protein
VRPDQRGKDEEDNAHMNTSSGHNRFHALCLEAWGRMCRDKGLAFRGPMCKAMVPLGSSDREGDVQWRRLEGTGEMDTYTRHGTDALATIPYEPEIKALKCS